jgi:hypothetical protein
MDSSAKETRVQNAFDDVASTVRNAMLTTS